MPKPKPGYSVPKTREPERKIVPAMERFKRHYVVSENGCWDWTGAKVNKGYGFFRIHPRYGTTAAHRSAYIMFKGEIPEGLTIDHLCKNIGCVNPEHLEAVPLAENLRRAHEGGQWRKTHCRKGHKYAEDEYNYRGYHECRICKKAAKEALDLRKKAALTHQKQ